MKFCPQCELEFPEHFRFCGACGGTLAIAAAQDEPEKPPPLRWRQGPILGFLALVFLAVLGIGAWYFWPSARSVVETSQASNSNQRLRVENVSTAPSYQPTPSIETTPDHSADEEITRLRQLRIEAKPSDSAEIISALMEAEKKYPTDYRFPYELSKLSIKGIVSHHEAFEPLFRAATKAIDRGQADEMLNSLTADKEGDFHKLAHGHHEWKMIEEALRNEDKRVLLASAH